LLLHLVFLTLLYLTDFRVSSLYMHMSVWQLVIDEEDVKYYLKETEYEKNKKTLISWMKRWEWEGKAMNHWHTGNFFFIDMIACMQHFISFFLFSNDLICDPIPYVSFVFIQLLFYTYICIDLYHPNLYWWIFYREI